jgi:segregation and condensation protein A
VTEAVAEIREAPPALDDLFFDLDVFDGPFDLLVTLILKEEVDLWEVRVSRIIADYVLRLADSDEFDLDATSHFVVLVASLLEMKSRRLLSEGILADELDALDEEVAGEELLASLVRYAQFKGAAGGLGRRFERFAGCMYRQQPVPERFMRRPAATARLDPKSLAGALSTLLREPPVPDVSHITDLAITLVQELRRLRDLLADEGSFTFASVAPRDRLEKAVTFFALLELHSRGEARLTQPRPFADITVTRLQPVVPGDAHDALAAVG